MGARVWWWVAVGLVFLTACGEDLTAAGEDGQAQVQDAPSAEETVADVPGSGPVDQAVGDGEAPGDAVPDTVPDTVPDAESEIAPDADPDTVPDAAPDAAATDVSGPCSGGCPAPADPCQVAVCHPAAGCVAVAKPDGAVCDDGNPCTGADLCSSGACQAGPAKACADSEPCTSDACDPATGACVHLPKDGTPCDDGNACTAGDACKGGACQAGPSTCACQTSSDCAGFEDGDLCNGTLYCDTDSHTCKVNPASLVVCPTDQDGPCAKAACDGKTGKCGLVPATDGTACDDGQTCTEGDHCSAGKCVAGVKTCCDSDADCQDDGNACNGKPFCNQAKHQCQLNPMTVVTCPSVDDTACAQNLCDKKTGQCALTAVAAGTVCDDGNPCTQGDLCDTGQCKPGTQVCACQQDADCAKLEDGDLCNGTLFCDKAKKQCAINPTTIVTCSTAGDTACAKAACQPATGKCQLAAVADGLPCDADANPCTPKDVCKAGACVPDTNVCPCQDTADCGKQDDGDLCNGTLYCDKAASLCKINPATVVFCPTADDTTCLKSTCNPKTGQCVPLPVGENAPCDADGNPCTVHDTCKAGKCVADTNACECLTDSDCGKIEDGNLCNGTLYCDKVQHVCKVNPATVVQCPDAFDTTCSQNVCDPKTGQCGKKNVNEAGHCDADGNACTLYDTCKSGVCVTGANLCGCTTDGDCGQFEDQDLCNGALFCDAAKTVKLCQVNPATVVKCPAGDPAACVTQACAAKTGKCGEVPWFDGKPCDDGQPCTAGDACLGGTCQGVAAACDDGNPCTADSCENGNGCVGLPTQATCVDGNPCTLDDACKDGKCQGTPASCDDGNPCTDDACDPKQAGCTHLAHVGKCDDGSACTSGDGCKNGTCTGAKIVCDDGNPCTADACDPKLGCQAAAQVAPCDDGNACTQGEACEQGKCAGGKAIACDDGNACTIDACQPALGCTAAIQAGTCDDGNACTTADTCAKGTCLGQKSACDDGNPCTGDACDPTSGCSHQATSGTCSDGDACTKDEACLGGKCTGGKAVSCDDGNACTSDGCDGQKGCVQTDLGGPCSDGNACTSGDACKSGLCLGAKTTCDDGNPCTADGCDPVKGCAFVAVDVPCSDGNACTTGDTCAAGKCAPGKALVCDDGNLCTTESCDAAKGCVLSLPATPCDDGSACTVGDACQGGSCVGQKVACDDGNPCTTDACDAKAGCQATASTAGCNDGDPCTTSDACKDGKCQGGAKTCDDGDVCTEDACNPATGVCAAKAKLDCGDGNPCTDDACHPKLGCGHLNNAAACDDGNPCTPKDACSSGGCVGTGTANCDDQNPCTSDACDSKAGCTHAANTASCDDGVACTVSDKCSGGQCKGTLQCDDGNPCTDDGCDFATGKCAVTAKSGPCDDGNACTKGETCSGGTCTPAEVVICDDGNVCTDDYCDAAKGGCKSDKYNTSACVAPGSCALDDVCVLGKCTTGKTPRLQAKLYNNSLAGDQIYGLFDWGDGTYLALGTTGNYGYSNQAWWLARLKPDGTAIWTQTWADTGGSAHAHRARLLPDGKMMVAGWGANLMGKIWAIVDKDGKREWLKSNWTYYGDQLHDLGYRQQGTPGSQGAVTQYVLCGAAGSDGLMGHVVVLDGTTHSKQVEYKRGCPYYGCYNQCYNVEASDTKGGMAYLGATKDAGGNGDVDAVFQLMNVGLQATSDVRIGGSLYDALYDMAPVGPYGSEGWVAAGETDSKGVKGIRNGWVVRLDAAGKVLWEHTFGGQLPASAYRLTGMQDGSWVIVGSQQDSSSTPTRGTYVTRLTAGGVAHWSKFVNRSPNWDAFHAAAVLPDGDLLLGGWQFVNSDDQSLIARYTPWLNESCTNAGGTCGALYWKDCDDGKLCTDDTCDFTSGCKALDNQLSCSDGDPCTTTDACSGGACQPGPALICDDGEACTTETCVKGKGCVFSPQPDGTVCGAGKTCKAAKCQ